MFEMLRERGGNDNRDAYSPVPSNAAIHPGRENGISLPYKARLYKKTFFAGFFVFSVLIIILVSSFAPSKPSSNTPSTTLSQSFLDYGNILNSVRDNSVSPCDDFYNHACGNWIKETVIPSDKNSFSRSFTSMADQNLNILYNISLENWPLTGPYFQSCMDMTTIDALGPQPLQSIFSSIDSAVDIDTLISVAGSLKYFEVSYSIFASVAIQVDPPNPSAFMLDINQGGLSLPLSYYSDPSYKESLIQHIANQFINTNIASDMPSALSYSNLVFTFENTLASFCLLPDEMRDPVALYNKYSFTQLKTLGAGFNWNNFLASILSYNSTQLASLNVNVDVPSFIVGLSQTVAVTPLSTLKYYLKWHMIKETSNYLSSNILTENFNFYGTQLQGITQMTARWKSCTNTVSNDLSDMMSRLYVNKVFSPASKTKSIEMIKLIEKAFANNLPSVSWMDQETKDAALVKLNLVTSLIGYPDKWDAYDGISVSMKTYFNNHASLAKKSNIDYFAKLNNKVDKTVWQMSAPTVNAYYDPSYNTINFPAGILAVPFFNELYPSAANFGGIGMVEGHELSHGYDDQGRQYDGNGALINWWTKNSLNNFNTKSKCLIDQYNRFTIPTGDHVNGNLTLGENIADNAGLKLSFLAWKLYESIHGSDAQILPDVSNDQLFFYSYAQTWCSVRRDKYAKLLIETDPHSPSNARVNGPVSNLQYFQDAFKCKTGDAMAPAQADRCLLW